MSATCPWRAIGTLLWLALLSSLGCGEIVNPLVDGYTTTGAGEGDTDAAGTRRSSSTSV